MRASLHFYNEFGEEPIFYQILNNDIDLSEGDIFNYNETYYYKLERADKKTFDSKNLTMGEYKIISTKIVNNKLFGDLRHIFLKPIE